MAQPVAANRARARPRPRSAGPIAGWLALALALPGCAHGAAASRTAAAAHDQAELVDALRRDNTAMRRRLAELEDRVVRLEHDADGYGPEDRTLPVVRLQPRARAEAEPPPDEAPSPRKRAPTRTLGNLPNSGAPDDDAWEDHEPLTAGEASDGPDKGASYRLVGTRLVQLTKDNAPTRPDRPPRDAAGNAVLTEYETAMALYKAGEIGGAERAFDIFARDHAKHDYADNALYWKGEAAYDQGHFDDALAAFTAVVERYGGGNKAADALLKIGLCYGKLGDDANARDVLVGLVDAYPDTRASDIARARLRELEG